LLRGLLNASDTEKAAEFFNRYGLLALTLARPVPVLAEASVILAGASRLRLSMLLAYTLPANLAIAVAYAGGTQIIQLVVAGLG
jgi:membrane protein DedA with SNARE-associated domain